MSFNSILPAPHLQLNVSGMCGTTMQKNHFPKTKDEKYLYNLQILNFYSNLLSKTIRCMDTTWSCFLFFPLRLKSQNN